MSSINEDTQLYEDASTLLMFANTAAKQQLTNTKPPIVETAPPVQQTKSASPDLNVSNKQTNDPRTVTATTQRGHKRSYSNPSFPNITSPGPAIAALAEETSSTNSSSNSNNMKAVIAAAALAAAADNPLPPLRVYERPILTKAKSNNNMTDVPQPKIEILDKEQSVVTRDVIPIDTPILDPKSTVDDNNTEDENEEEEKMDIAKPQESSKSEEPVQETASKPTEPEPPAEEPIKEPIEEPIDEPMEQPKEESNSDSKENSTGIENEEEDEVDEDQELESVAVLQAKGINKNPHLELSTYIVDPEEGLVGCICEIADDDGNTVQCDLCNRWQHIECMDYQDTEGEYLCYLCDPSSYEDIDAEKCRANVLERLQELNQPKRRRSGNFKDPKRAESPRSETPNSNGSNTNGDVKRKKLKTSKIEDDEDNLDATEGYQSIYYSLKDNDFKNLNVKRYLNELGKRFNSSEVKSDQISVMELSEFKGLELHHPVNNLSKKKPINKVTVKAYTEHLKQKYNGISRLGLFINHNIEENKPIIEYLGEIDLFETFMNDKINQYNIWGTTKPKVMKQKLTVGNEEVNVVIDSRFVGNEARFIRRACPTNSNCQVKAIYLSAKNQFRFVIYSTKPIVKDTELKLSWEWDSDHPILKMYDGMKFDQLVEDEKNLIIKSIDTILSFTECGCSNGNSNECLLSKIRKSSAHLLRSTRKGNIKFNPDDDNSNNYISITARLDNRDNQIMMNTKISSSKLVIEEIDDEEGLTVLPYKYQELLTVEPRSAGPRAKGEEDERLSIPIPILKLNNVENVEKSIKKKLTFSEYKKKK